ncbi:MAG: hypothetical protein ABGY24_13025 [bacterium]
MRSHLARVSPSSASKFDPGLFRALVRIASLMVVGWEGCSTPLPGRPVDRTRTGTSSNAAHGMMLLE